MSHIYITYQDYQFINMCYHKVLPYYWTHIMYKTNITDIISCMFGILLLSYHMNDPFFPMYIIRKKYRKSRLNDFWLFSNRFDIG